MKITATNTLTEGQRDAIYYLWNKEYPAQITFTSTKQMDDYLNHFKDTCHYFAVNEQGDTLGWAFSFTRDNEIWFAIIVDSIVQRKGIGSSILKKLKEENTLLNGWVTEHNKYLKSDGTVYYSPLSFYINNGFATFNKIKLDNINLSAIKIVWEGANNTTPSSELSQTVDKQ